MKKLPIILAILLVFSFNVFAQEDNNPNNIVSVSFGIIGAELSYERMLSNHFSVLGSISYTTLILMDEFTLSGKGRWYPFAKSFFMEMGLGYTYGKGFIAFSEEMGSVIGHILLGMITLGAWFYVYDFNDFEEQPRTGGLLIQPGMGWNIRLGRNGRFYLPLSTGIDIKLAQKPDFMPYLRLGLGFSF